MKLIVLGSGSSVPHPERSSSGYWLDTDGGSILLDCSASSIHRLAQEGCDWANLDAVWISHFHLDHCGGLAPFLFGTKYAPITQSRTKPMRIVGPPGLKKLVEVFNSAYDYGLLRQPFPCDIIEIEPGKGFDLLEGVRAKTFSTPHTDESCAIRIEDSSGSMAFSADTGYSTNLGVFARGVDLLLIECSFLNAKPVEIHLNLADIEQIARFAKPKKIVLTHLYPEWDDHESPVEIGGVETTLAFDGLKLEIERELVTRNLKTGNCRSTSSCQFRVLSFELLGNVSFRHRHQFFGHPFIKVLFFCFGDRLAAVAPFLGGVVFAA